MTKPVPTDARQTKRRQQYLQQLFLMHPMWQATQILELRRRALGLKSSVEGNSKSHNVAELAKLRERVKEQIGQVQQEFWTMPLGQLKRKLEGIPVDKIPEFRPAVVRLRTTAAARGHFPALTQFKGMDMELFRAFMKAVVLPPAEAGFHREKFLQKINSKAQLKQIRRSVEHIRSEHEILYGLEKDWFETMLTMKPRKSASQRQPSVSVQLPEFGWGTWFFVIVVLRIVLRMIMSG